MNLKFVFGKIMKIQNKILALVLVTAIGLSLSGRACANTALGHVTVGLAVLIDMTENPAKYAGIKDATKGVLSAEDFQLNKVNGVYQVRFDDLKPAARAFMYGSIAPDDNNDENWHYVDPQGRVKSIFQKAENNDDIEKAKMDYAYGYGTKSHVLSDWKIHPYLPQAKEGPLTLARHGLWEQEFDLDGYNKGGVEIVALKNQLLAGKYKAKLKEGDVNGLIIKLAELYGTFRGKGKAINPISLPNITEYDVHKENVKYYQENLKCEKCGKKLDMVKNRTEEIKNNITRKRISPPSNEIATGLAKIKLMDYLSIHRSQLAIAGLSEAKDLDDCQPLPKPYKCDCGESDSPTPKPSLTPKPTPAPPSTTPSQEDSSGGQGNSSSGSRPPRRGLFTVPGYDVGGK